MWRQPKLQYGTRSTLQVYATYYATHIIFRMSLHKERNLNLLLFVALTLSSSARWKKTKKMTLELTVPPTIKVNRVVKNTNSCIRLYLLENTAVADPGKGPVSPLTFGPNWGPKARKCFLSRPPPLISGSGWPPPPHRSGSALYGTERRSNGTDREMPSLALRICEFYHSYF